MTTFQVFHLASLPYYTPALQLAEAWIGPRGKVTDSLCETISGVFSPF
jgi:hypothetical protein